MKKTHVKGVVGLKCEALWPFQVKCSYWSVTLQRQLTHSPNKIHFQKTSLTHHSDYYSRHLGCYVEFLLGLVTVSSLCKDWNIIQGILLGSQILPTRVS